MDMRPIHDSTAPRGTSKYTLTNMRDFTPIGTSIPQIPADLYEKLVIRAKIVDGAPKYAHDAEKAKTKTGFAKFLAMINGASPAIVARQKAMGRQVDGRYYSTGPDGEIIETTIERK